MGWPRSQAADAEADGTADGAAPDAAEDAAAGAEDQQQQTEEEQQQEADGPDEAAKEQAADDLALTMVMSLVSSRPTLPLPPAVEARDSGRDAAGQEQQQQHGGCSGACMCCFPESCFQPACPPTTPEISSLPVTVAAVDSRCFYHRCRQLFLAICADDRRRAPPRSGVFSDPG